MTIHYELIMKKFVAYENLLLYNDKKFCPYSANIDAIN